MAEQETEQIEKEEKEEDEIVTIDPRSYNKEKPVSKEEIKKRQKIVRLRTENVTWPEVARAVDLSTKQAKKIYQEEMALGIATNKKNNDQFDKYINSMEKRYGEIVETVDRLHALAKRVIDDFESEDIHEMKTFVKFMKSAGVILRIIKEIKEQIGFIQQEQQKIKIKQQNLYFGPVDINNHLTTVLNSLHKEGTITINRKLPFDKN